MFHVEFRQFPNVARSFNLSRAELESGILAPWAAERPVVLDDRRFTPEKAKLTVYEGPRLAPEQIGLGRGWANVTRSGQDVTARVLEEVRAVLAPAVPDSVRRIKHELCARAEERPMELGEVLALAAETHPGRRVSEQLALAEQSVWELLHQRHLRILRGGQELRVEDWAAVLLARETWLARSELRLARAKEK